MPANTLRKYRQIIDLVEDLPGADRAADLLRVEITGQAASTTVDTNLTEVSGTAQAGADWTSIFQSTRDAVQLLDDAVQSNAVDELRTRVFGPDAGGVLQQAQVEAFNSALAAGDFGVATWGDRALRSISADHRQTVIHGLDQGGAIEEVGVEAFNSAAAAGGFALLSYGDRALQTQAQDEFRSRQFAVDGAGVLQQVNAEAFDTALATTDIGVATWGDRALQEVGQDEFRSRIHDSGGVQIDPLNQDVLQTVAADELRTRLFQPDAGGVLQQVIAEQLDTAVAATDVGLLTWVARALDSIGQDELVSRVTDSTGTQIDPAQSAEYPNNAASQDLVGTGDLVVTVSVEKSEAVIISANSADGNTWSASIRWLDPGGTEVMAESATDIGLDTVIEDNARLTRKGAQLEVTFTDESGGAANTVDTYIDTHR